MWKELCESMTSKWDGEAAASRRQRRRPWPWARRGGRCRRPTSGSPSPHTRESGRAQRFSAFSLPFQQDRDDDNNGHAPILGRCEGEARGGERRATNGLKDTRSLTLAWQRSPSLSVASERGEHRPGEIFPLPPICLSLASLLQRRSPSGRFDSLRM